MFTARPVLGGPGPGPGPGPGRLPRCSSRESTERASYPASRPGGRPQVSAQPLRQRASTWRAPGSGSDSGPGREAPASPSSNRALGVQCSSSRRAQNNYAFANCPATAVKPETRAQRTSLRLLAPNRNSPRRRGVLRRQPEDKHGLPGGIRSLTVKAGWLQRHHPEQKGRRSSPQFNPITAKIEEGNLGSAVKATEDRLPERTVAEQPGLNHGV